MRIKSTLKVLAYAAGVAGMISMSGVSSAAEINKIHFLIPGGAGGGWDGTARGTGEALTKAGIVGKATYENMSGGGGADPTTYYGGTERGYTDYPSLAQERGDEPCGCVDGTAYKAGGRCE